MSVNNVIFKGHSEQWYLQAFPINKKNRTYQMKDFSYSLKGVREMV